MDVTELSQCLSSIADLGKPEGPHAAPVGLPHLADSTPPLAALLQDKESA